MGALLLCWWVGLRLGHGSPRFQGHYALDSRGHCPRAQRSRTRRASRTSPAASGTLAKVVRKGRAAAIPREVGS